MPRVSVVVPVYNAHPQYLAESVASIVCCLPADSEILIGLDGDCSDGCMRVLEQIRSSTNTPPIRILSYKHQGLVNTLNMLIDECDCEYIARADADDICLPNRISMQISALEANKKAQFCGTQILRCDKTLRPFKRQRKFPVGFAGQLVYSSCLNNPIAHPTLLIKRCILGESPYQNIAGAEDWDLYIRLWQNGYQSFNLGQVGLFYRIHARQITKKSRSLAVAKALKRQTIKAAISYDKRFAMLLPLQTITQLLDLYKLAQNLKPWIDA